MMWWNYSFNHTYSNCFFVIIQYVKGTQIAAIKQLLKKAIIELIFKNWSLSLHLSFLGKVIEKVTFNIIACSGYYKNSLCWLICLSYDWMTILTDFKFFFLSCHVQALTTPYNLTLTWRRTSWLYCNQLSHTFLSFSRFSPSL